MLMHHAGVNGIGGNCRGQRNERDGHLATDGTWSHEHHVHRPTSDFYRHFGCIERIVDRRNHHRPAHAGLVREQRKQTTPRPRGRHGHPGEHLERAPQS